MTIALWEPLTGRERGRMVGHGGSITCIAFGGEMGEKLASGSNDLSLRLWEVETFKEIACVPEHGGAVTCLAASPDGKLLCSGSNLGMVQVVCPSYC
eukprot:scaffold319811_cov51-Prasinocladus_malaysianus.AAC.1